MYIGIDVGGTSVKWGILDDELNIVEKSSFPTCKNSDMELLEEICAVINEKKLKYDFKYVGMGSPGCVDTKNGIISGSANTPFKNTPAADIVKKKTGLPLIAGNDANCAAYGEYVFSDTKSENLVMITLGTGVGGGIVMDGKLYTGTRGFAGEIGHMIISHNGAECACGRHGCFEAYASATALIRMFRERIIAEGGKLSGVEISPDAINGKNAFELAEQGNVAANEILDQYASYLATGINNIEMIFDPGEIVLAGGITNDKEALMKYLEPYIKNISCKISVSKLKNDAGFIGAALLGR